MNYVWDSAKDALNRRKHHLSLADGISALEDPDRESWVDDRFDYQEERMITLGLNHGLILLVVSAEAEATEDEQVVRIISVRKATHHEAQWYYRGHP